MPNGRTVPADTLGKGAWLTLGLIGLANLLNYFDRFLVVVLSEPLRLEFELSDTQYGILTGPAFVTVYAISSIVFGWLADRFARKRIIAAVLALWSGMTAVCGLASSFITLAIARAGVGVGEGGSNPAALSLLTDNFPPHKRPGAMAIFGMMGMFGLFLSFVIGSWIAIHFGWRAVFLAGAIPGLVVAVMILIWAREPARGHFDGLPETRAGSVANLKSLWHNGGYMWTTGANSFASFGNFGMLTWLPQFFIRSHGMSFKEVGTIFGPAAALGLCAGLLLGGWLGNRLSKESLSRPIWICVVITVILVPLYLVVLWTPSVEVAVVVTFVAMAGSVAYAPAYQAIMLTVCAPGLRASAAAGSNVLSALLGYGFLVLTVGLVSDWLAASLGEDSLRWALSFGLVYLLIAAAGFYRSIGFVRARIG